MNDGFEFFSFVFSMCCFVILIMALSDYHAVEKSEDYEIFEIESIREYSGLYGRKRIRVAFDEREKSFNAIDIKIDETTHIREYDNYFNSIKLYLSPDDYNKYVGQYESFESLEGE